MLVKYMRLEEEKSFKSALVSDLDLADFYLSKISKSLSRLKESLRDGDSSNELSLNLSETTIQQVKDLNHIVSLFHNNISNYLEPKAEEKEILTEKKTGLEEVMEKLEAISNKRGLSE